VIVKSPYSGVWKVSSLVSVMVLFGSRQQECIVSSANTAYTMLAQRILNCEIILRDDSCAQTDRKQMTRAAAAHLLPNFLGMLQLYPGDVKLKVDGIGSSLLPNSVPMSVKDF
jgi:hypothetical protein